MNRWKSGSILGLTCLALLNSLAFAGKGNLGGDDSGLERGKHVLTPNNSQLNVARILYAPSEPDDPAYRAAVGAAAGAIVDYFDARVATPSPELLATYDCIFTWANYAYDDQILFGDRLADFVDLGGHVVLGQFCVSSGNHLEGRIMTAAYSPVVSSDGGVNFSISAYVGDGNTCIHTGVLGYASAIRDHLVLQGAGMADGTYADGQIAHAYRPDRKVIYSNGSGDGLSVSLGASGDWPLLIANTCACSEPVSVQPSTWGSIKALYR